MTAKRNSAERYEQCLEPYALRLVPSSKPYLPRTTVARYV